VLDEVIYATDTPWPIVKNSGSSLQFLAPAGVDPAIANDDAKNWVASDSTNSDAFPEHGRGTPGKAAGAATQPIVAKKSKP
jgi:hypothetical protein